MSERILALIVTHNRQHMLRDCLELLAAQTRKPNHTLVIDNASTDDTPALLAQHQVEHIRLEKNTGAAGGFHFGLAEACRRDFDWVWLLDDDAHPRPDSLQKLLEGLERARGIGPEPNLLLSRLLWVDGRVHPMGVPWPDLRKPGLMLKARSHGLMPVRFGTYASMLVNLRAAQSHPLPTAAYFLYNDDLEYSGRLLRRGWATSCETAWWCTKPATPIARQSTLRTRCFTSRPATGPGWCARTPLGLSAKPTGY